MDAVNEFIAQAAASPWVYLVVFAVVLVDAFFPPVPSESDRDGGSMFGTAVVENTVSRGRALGFRVPIGPGARGLIDHPGRRKQWQRL